MYPSPFFDPYRLSALRKVPAQWSRRGPPPPPRRGRSFPALALLAALITVGGAPAAAQPVTAELGGLTGEDLKVLTDIPGDAVKATEAAKSVGILAGLMGFLLLFVKVLRGPGLKLLALLGRVIPGKVGAFCTSVVAWFKTSTGGWVLNLGSGAIGAMLPFTAGVPFTAVNVVALLGAGIYNSLAAAGSVELKKDLTGAQAAGLKAAGDPGSVLGG